ncbi:uncharacterized protein LOC124451322 isoform X4 [Xenia sp. Carnegie-2017]|uniref:uncharacterized protein LOC124451322 isoform X4 n=1 Tax=Xenia sp. Carnegie-2017 TaxID=2897299 RepID=UPI001F037513|nr:uncharacterized protein LOC124451322 isoform X4 [Xenia sp. Carnegie-2017]XP_046857894.1 uncharacterized protein LOC124451322 isoform X4 [Xenia sp. Carnegie-2017]
MQVYRRKQEERLGQNLMAEVVHTFYAEQEHATEINVTMEEDLLMVDVSVKVVGQEHVATKISTNVHFLPITVTRKRSVPITMDHFHVNVTVVIREMELFVKILMNALYQSTIVIKTLPVSTLMDRFRVVAMLVILEMEQFVKISTNVLFQWITVIKIQLASTAMDCFLVIVMQDLQETERFVKRLNRASRVLAKNNGLCTNMGGTFSCDCADGFKGKTCEVGVCDHSSCKNGGSCLVDGNSYKCICLPDFIGAHCEKGN